MKTKRRETDIVRAILDYLAVQKIPARRMNTGAFSAEYKGKKRFHRFGAPGMPDIMACLPPVGRLLLIEVKREGEEPSKAQEMFLDEFHGVGALAMVAHSVDDVDVRLARIWRRPEDECHCDDPSIPAGAHFDTCPLYVVSA